MAIIVETFQVSFY